MSSSPKVSAAEETSQSLLQMVRGGAILYVIAVILNSAFRIRMGAIEEYGTVIHEFDPVSLCVNDEVSYPLTKSFIAYYIFTQIISF
jgi:hypothetical protein